MLFHTLDFALFLPIVFVLYWFVTNRNLRLQNLFIVGASYVFYGWWDWRFLSLLAFSSLVDFFIGVKLSNEEKTSKRKFLLATSLFVNLGLLGFFKYYNFFVDSFVDAFSLFGNSFEITHLKIVLPVGISFYTFQTLSYSIDVYRKKLEPTKDVVSFFAFVSFFPQLVAGPIERASNLLPQFYTRREFSYENAVDGMRQILWGLVKKVIIADLCAVYVNNIFKGADALPGPVLFLGAVFFAFQIYGDFSGYSDIAIGVSRLFGFSLMRNFAYPYFSRDIAEFWRRWHISLSTWFRDYLYIPLGGSQGGLWSKLRNTMIIFVVSGFWHGANWTFVFWGALNALYFIPLLVRGKNRNNLDIVAEDKIIPSLSDFLRIVYTFIITCFAWIFFRADNVSSAFKMIGKILVQVASKLAYIDTYNYLFYKVKLPVFMFLFIFIIIEWLGRKREFALQGVAYNLNPFARWALYLILFFFVLALGGNEVEFIYFQF